MNFKNIYIEPGYDHMKYYYEDLVRELELSNVNNLDISHIEIFINGKDVLLKGIWEGETYSKLYIDYENLIGIMDLEKRKLKYSLSHTETSATILINKRQRQIFDIKWDKVKVI